ncbi:acyl-ACP--UDP-N-acetylglucosamine O-acyltransferase [Ereboglobus luteus]|uniref:Acyl-[acyl-carrier-protein]--UDP-N-acetylglucosamine O-acyltransferase n=1 Tax=Ereboglobus luteus TaxID=1796921 RepID=A0A2U8E3J2_9BACT|nr:acyl-ACP--UDP-N-acetylglucosamine O-acyltransferase [Ereboglobus luteus]AWI09443.1 acyl-[acyl-carrier-protein]--UDP-N-acetylglucosamine O-acyltransferase [Ereboglobus luteus]
MATFIHPTAIIEPGAQIGADCEILAGAVIKEGVVLGDRVAVGEYSVIGGAPQSIGFDRSLKTGVRIGADTVIREHVTISRATHEGCATVIGEKCFIMATAHVAHDCALADNVIMANAVLLAGHVSVGTSAFIGGGAVVHQFVRIGESVMISGNASISQDLAPFTLVAERDGVVGLNLIGLKRRGFSREAIREIKDAFREVYHARTNIRNVAADALAAGRYATPEAGLFLQFFSGGKRGFARLMRKHGESESGAPAAD